ncbi:nucleotidyltransferase [Clostridium manihotivorum]|uniref:nucleotidyltransferase n=1 Tax=Clostridium manihotivorum TaxID=2320868 RepID=UPI0013E31809|nr:nucleotidyltransferase [Clostridium manihotivorum]
MKFEDLYYIADKLNANDIRWVIGSSVLLYFHGIVDKPNDIDIIIDEKDIVRAKKIFDEIGIEENKENMEPFLTEYFYTYIVKNTYVDVMCNFALRHDYGIYRFILDEEAIVENKKVNDSVLPLSSLEDWYVLYQLMPGRESKIKMIEDYLKENGVESFGLLQRALKQELPVKVVESIKLIYDVKE